MPAVLLPPPPLPDAPPIPPTPPFAAASEVACAELEQVIARAAQPPVPPKAITVKAEEFPPEPPRVDETVPAVPPAPTVTSRIEPRVAAPVFT